MIGCAPRWRGSLSGQGDQPDEDKRNRNAGMGNAGWLEF